MDEPDGSQEALNQKESHTRNIDLINRDPKQIHDDVIKVDFEDVVAEPDGTHSVDLVWKCSNIAFTFTKLWFYRSLTILFGFILSVLWGLVFAITSFVTIWAVGPTVRFFQVLSKCLCQPLLVGIRTTLLPLFVAVGKMANSVKGIIRKDA
ncbi:caveolin-1-like [Symphorus nematophorus]